MASSRAQVYHNLSVMFDAGLPALILPGAAVPVLLKRKRKLESR